MIFADKLIYLRKKSGWSQEELAEQINVSRQSVSKWEGAQSIPDLEKIIRLSELFGVSTDYLLKDEIEEPEAMRCDKEFYSTRRISLESATEFIETKRKTATYIAIATFLCIISPVCLILLSTFAEMNLFSISENLAAGIGLIVLFVFVAVAVALYIFSGSMTAPFQFLDNEVFEAEYGVVGMAKKKKKDFQNTYTLCNIIATCLCILSLIPLFVGVIINEDNDLLIVSLLSIMFLVVGMAVIVFIKVGIINESYSKLLQENEYSAEYKQKSKLENAIAAIYWPIVTIIYFTYSFMTFNWHISWIIWIIAGILYSGIVGIIKVFDKNI